jgi:uncharacterized membrane protein YbaN (DUF454 family)
MIIRILLTVVAGCAFLALALVGFVVPILPGFVFLIPALLCFAAVSPTFGRWLDRNRVWRTVHAKWRRGAGLPLGHRIKLMFWLGADATLRAAHSAASSRRPPARRR